MKKILIFLTAIILSIPAFGQDLTKTNARMMLDAINSKLTTFGYFNVKDYGAVMDGVTDDAIAFQAAINAAGDAGGGTVIIPAGVMAISILDKSAIYSRDSVLIKGAGKDISIIRCTPTSIDSYSVYGTLFNLATYKNLQLEDLTITGAYTNAGTQVKITYAIMNTSVGSDLMNVKVKNVKFTNWGYVFRTSTSSGNFHAEFEGVDFDICKMGIQSSISTNNGSELIMNNCTFDHVGRFDGVGANPDHSIYIYEGIAAKITNSYFDNQYDGYAVDFVGGAEDSCLYKIVNNCIFDNLKDGGITFRNTADEVPLIVNNCFFYGGVGSGMYIYTGRVIITNSYFDVVNSIIGVADGYYVNVDNCKFNIDSGGDYAFLATAIGSLNVNNSTFVGGSATAYAFYLTHDDISFTIRNSFFTGNIGRVVFITASITRGVFDGNYVDISGTGNQDVLDIDPAAAETITLEVSNNYVKDCRYFIINEPAVGSTVNLIRSRNTVVTGTGFLEYELGIHSFYSNYVTKKYVVGVYGEALANFTFSNDADSDEENKDLGAIIPAKAKIVRVEIVCIEALAGSGAHEIDIGVGNTSSGEQFIAAASVDDINNVLSSTAVLTDAVVMNWSTATNVFVQANPDANWSTYTGGRWAVYITYCLYEL